MSQDRLTKLLENVERTLKNSGKHDDWDDFVPVIKENSMQTTVYLTDKFEEPNYYNKLCYALMNANEIEHFTLVINSPGGMLDSAFMVSNAILSTQASVTAYLAGTVASAATIVALSCDEVIASENLAFMIHNYSSGMHGKGHEMKARQIFFDNELNKSFNQYYLGFLSQEEITDVIEGKDIWLNCEEVNERWQAKKKMKQPKVLHKNNYGVIR